MYAAARHANPSLTAPAARAVAGFTPLELRVLRLAASGSERPSTAVEPALRRAGRRVAAAVMARRTAHELADPRLEALRSYAASVRMGRADGLAIFHAAGYTAGHAQAVKRYVAAALRGEQPAKKRERLVYAGGLSLGVASIAGFVAMTGTLLAGV